MELADDPESYGAKAGKTIITTQDGELEICGVIDANEANRIVGAHNESLDCPHLDFTENQNGDTTCRDCGLHVEFDPAIEEQS